MVLELAPSLNWKEVVLELDHAGFLCKDRHAFRLLWSALQLGLQSQGIAFPVELALRAWNNADGQVSLLAQMLKNTDLVCMADYPHHPINVEILKSPPEPDNKKLANWKCLGLLETLLSLLQAGGAQVYGQVQELLKEPMQHCPDVLVLGLLQLHAQQPMSKLKQELLASLIPVFLSNHPNSAIILHHAWHAPAPPIKSLVMHAMAEWYMRAEHDQSRLSRILDVAQDLKVLTCTDLTLSMLDVMMKTALDERAQGMGLVALKSGRVAQPSLPDLIQLATVPDSFFVVHTFGRTLCQVWTRHCRSLRVC